MPANKDKERGTWSSRFYYVDWTGARKEKQKRGFATKKEALVYETEFKRKASANMDMKFESFVEIYLRDKTNELKGRTLRNKEYMLATHVTPYFKDKKMNEITASDLLEWQNTIRENHDYSQAYLRMLQNQLTAVLNHAQRIYNLENNPSKRVKKMGKSDERSLDFWTYDEYKQFIDTYELGSMHYLIFEILFWTGCREGELLALTMNDIDISDCSMRINKTYFRNKGEDFLTKPKTESSVRKIELPEFLIKEIREYESRCYGLCPDDRLFPIVAEAVQHTMKYHIKKAGVKKIRVHDLRHSHVAYLIHHNVQPLIIKERLGHKDIKITLNTYGHLYPSEQKKVASMLDNMNR